MAYQPSIQAIFDNIRHVHVVPPRPGVITYSDWSDAKLDELARPLKVPNSIKELPTYKVMLYHFYNFYFNGILPENQSPHNIVYFFLSAISFGTTDERHYFIPQEHFAPTGFFTLPPLTDPVTPIADTRVPLAGQHIPIGIPAEDVAIIQALYFTPTNPDKATFLLSINRLIAGFSALEMTPGNQMILKLTFFLALLLFRGISKDSIQLERGVNKKLIKEHIHNLAGWPVANSYCPPSKSCVELCAVDFNKGNAHANRMITLILSSWKKLQEEGTETYGLIPQLQAALLSHTAGNGLGLVMMMYNACEFLSITISELIKHTLTDQSNASWTVLTQFLKQYLDTRTPERTYLWARLVNDGYFTEYAARAHPYLAGMFAGIIGSQQTIGSIKQAAWYTQKFHLAEQGYTWGKAVVDKLSQRIDTPQLPEGVEVASFLPPPAPRRGQEAQEGAEAANPFDNIPVFQQNDQN